ncbi:hypothetical protein P3T16_000759 [Paraburkholderia sp. GAS42]|jgi:hypothetical protein
MKVDAMARNWAVAYLFRVIANATLIRSLTRVAIEQVSRTIRSHTRIRLERETRMTRTGYRIAVIPGDGIGKEVMPEALRALDAVSQRFNIALAYQHIEWASRGYYAERGKRLRHVLRESLRASRDST